MRILIAILGVFSMLVVLHTPIAALSAVPCDSSLMAMPDEAPPCGGSDVACMAPCLTAAKCQSQCAYSPPFVPAGSAPLLSPLVVIGIASMEYAQPLGTYSPVEGPPPKL